MRAIVEFLAGLMLGSFFVFVAVACGVLTFSLVMWARGGCK